MSAMHSTQAIPRSHGGWRFDHSYTRLPAELFERTKPDRVCRPVMAVFNRALAMELGLAPEGLDSTCGAVLFSGNELPPGAEPIAQAYAGHQFGHFTMLGDGRAVLLGEQLDPAGRRWDVQLKGSGRTRYSRRGDGRAALGPMLREYIISEAMHGLGIPTTRSLAVVATGETVHRDEPLPGAVLVRVAASHIRVGTFEYAASLGDPKVLAALVDYTIQRHFPECASESAPGRAFLEAVCRSQATLIAKWFSVGFIHGVMNTDNMALSGETIDYGPCAFMDAYDPETVFSSIDRNGRYAFSQQPVIAHWNLARLAESVAPILHSCEEKGLEMAKEALSVYPGAFKRAWLDAMGAKIGLFEPTESDVPLVEDLLVWMLQTKADFTNSFRHLDPESGAAGSSGWRKAWVERLGRQSQSFADARGLMQRSNPAVIPRNHKVEGALQAAMESDDYSSLRELLDALESPYEDKARNLEFLTPGPPSTTPYRTFCGT